jgi:hypothetical protein
VTTLAVVNNGRSFIGTSKLYLRVSDTSPSTFWAVHVGVDLVCTDLVSHDGLRCREFRTEKRREIGWFRPRYDRPGRGVCRSYQYRSLFHLLPWCRPGSSCVDSLVHTFIFCAATLAMKNVLLTAFRRRQKIAAVRAKYQRPDGRHGIGNKLRLRTEEYENAEGLEGVYCSSLL